MSTTTTASTRQNRVDHIARALLSRTFQRVATSTKALQSQAPRAHGRAVDSLLRARQRAERLGRWSAGWLRAAGEAFGPSLARTGQWLVGKREAAYVIGAVACGLLVAAWSSGIVAISHASFVVLTALTASFLMTQQRQHMRAVHRLHLKVDSMLLRVATAEQLPMDVEELDDTTLESTHAKVSSVAANLESEIALRRAFSLPKAAPFTRTVPPPLPRKLTAK
jgi:hypothetical protein